MAIEFALFGLGSQKGAGLLKVGESEGTVTLEFSVNGTAYEVTRTLVRKRTSVNQGEGFVRTPEGVIHLSPAELKEKVLEILNFKEPASPNAQSVIYRYAVFTPQEEMKYILIQRSSERIQTLRKAFGIEDYKVASDNSLELARYIKEGIIKLQERSGDVDRKKSELAENEKAAEKLKKERDELTGEQTALIELQKGEKEQLEELRKLEKKYTEATTQIPLVEESAEEKRKGVRKLEKESSQLQKEIDEELQPTVEGLGKTRKPTSKDEKALRTVIMSLKKLESRRDVLLGKDSTVRKSIASLEKRLKQYKDKSSKNIRAEIVKLQKLETQAKRDIKKIRPDLKKVTDGKRRLEFRESELKEKIADLKGVGGVCPICERKLTADHKKHLKEEREEKLKEIQKELPDAIRKEKELNNRLDSMQKQFDESKDKISELKGVADLLEDLETKKKELSDITKDSKTVEAGLRIEEEEELPTLSRYDNPSEYVQDLLSRLDEYQNAQTKIAELSSTIEKNKRRMQEIKNEVSGAEREIERISKELRQVKEVAEKYKGIPFQVQSLDSAVEARELKISNLSNKIGSANAHLDELKKAAEILGNEIKRKETEKTLLTKFQDYYVWLTDFFVPTLSAIEKQVMIAIRQDFEASFHRWYSMLLEEPDKDARIDEEFTPIIEQDGYEQDVGFLSGGERTSIALAYRLALNMTVQKVSTGMRSNLLILDEPTDGFSKVQLFKVREILRELNCPQVILVSHEKELESFADQIFEVQKSNGTSSIISK
jgi:exonuclease SbcC